MHKRFALPIIASLLLSAVAVVAGAGHASAAPTAPPQAVTATSIRVGIPYVDLAAVRQFGITLDQGSFPDAYGAIIANLNAQGGINGRKLVPYLVAVNPVGTGPAITACTQLAEDDAVFVAIAPQQADCFLQQHNVPTISGMFQDAGPSTGTPNFTLLPPAAAYDPVQLAVLDHRGVFKNKKVGIFAGTESDGSELKVVQASLQSLGVRVVESAVDGAPQSDEVATNQQAGLIAERFQGAGVNEVIAVGTGATVWPESLQANESSYLPAWIATNESGLESAVLGSSIQPKYLENVLTTSPVPSNYTLWHTPAVQQCDRVVRKAYPTLKITPPTDPLTGSDQTFYAVESACLNIDLFSTIAKAAGKNLTWSTFAHAGYSLRNAAIPGSGAPVSFAPGRPYELGPVYIVTFDRAKNVLQFADTPASK
jgi:Periplasmic binding protein